jgi:hypothetical protein
MPCQHNWHSSSRRLHNNAPESYNAYMACMPFPPAHITTKGKGGFSWFLQMSASVTAHDVLCKCQQALHVSHAGARGPTPLAWAAAAAAGASAQQCFEQPCQDAPFNMHASRTGNSSMPDATMACFQFVSIGCYAAPKGCCPEVARRFTGVEFDISKCIPSSCLRTLSAAATTVAHHMTFRAVNPL